MDNSTREGKNTKTMHRLKDLKIQLSRRARGWDPAGRRHHLYVKDSSTKTESNVPTPRGDELLHDRQQTSADVSET